MSDVVERFRADLERFGDDDEGAAALRSVFEDEVLPHVRELEQRALDEAWDIVEVVMGPPEGESDVDTARRAADLIRAARESDGEVGSREALRVVAEQLGLPPDVGVSMVVARARDVVSAVQVGMGAQAELVGRFADAAGVSARGDVAEVVAAVWDLRAQSDARGDALREIVGVCAVRDAGSAPDPDPRAVVTRVRNTVEGLRIRLGADGGLDLDERDRSMLREIGEGRLRRSPRRQGGYMWRWSDGMGDGMLSSSEVERLDRLVAAGLVEVEDTEDPLLTGHGWREVEVPSPTFTAGVGWGLSGGADGRPRAAADVRADALGEIARLVFAPNPDAVVAARVAGPYPGEVVARVRAVVDALVRVAESPGVRPALEPFGPAEAVRSHPDLVADVTSRLGRAGEVELVAVPSPDVVVTTRVMELLRAADDLHRLAVGGPGWSRVARDRTWVAAWLTRRAREVVDAPVDGPAGGPGG